jgi:DNA polymerase
MPPDPGLIAALRFQIDAGADEAIGEAPVDRYAAARAPAPEAAPKTPPPPPPVEPAPLFAGEPEPTPRAGRAPALVSAREAGETARALAAAAGTVAELAAAVGRYDGCELKLTANRTVFADGNPEARLMIVGEAPGAEEDRQGLPFVGPAGQLLDRMLASIGLDRGSAYITNVVYWRPPGNRNPTGAEIATCLPFLVRHIELVAPAVLALAGGTAAKALLATTEGIMKLRGRWFTYESPGLARPIPVRAIFHPAFLLRSQGQKREAWRDLIAIRKRLEAGSP